MKWLLNMFLVLIASAGVYYVGKYLLLGSVIICIIQAVRKLKKEPLSELFYELACARDEVLNVMAGPLFNLICFNPFKIKNVVHWFGSRKHTLSMIFGINWDNLHFVSKFFCWLFVELWDPGHFARAAESLKKLSCQEHDLN